jgi:glycosyltransferase involved in cell wall biosynthesis
MKITIVQGGAYPVPPVRGGAIEKVWFSLGKEFAKRGQEVTHISRKFPGLPDDQWLDGVHHVRVQGFEFSSKRFGVLWRDLGYVRRVLRVLPAADILVTNTPLLPLFIRDSRFGALYVHVGRYPKWQTRFYRHASRIQTVSRPVAEALIRQDRAAAGKVCVIPYPLPGPVSALDVPATWPQRRKEVLYVGRVHPEKGVHLLIDAFKLLIESGVSDWRLIVVGPWATAQGGGGTEYYESLRSRSAPIASQVELAGPIFDADALAACYLRAKLFVYPSLAEHGESFGLAPLEAMAHGCPPLVSNLACFRDFIEDQRSGYVFEHRADCPAEELYRALKSVVSGDGELMSIAVRSHEAARHYDPERVAEMYLEDFAAVRVQVDAGATASRPD